MARLATQPIYEAYRQGHSDASTATDLVEVHSGPLTAYSILDREPVAVVHVALHVGTHRHIAQLVQQEHVQQSGGQLEEDTNQEDTEEDGGDVSDPEVWQDVGVQTSFHNNNNNNKDGEDDKEAEVGQNTEKGSRQSERYGILHFIYR